MSYFFLEQEFTETQRTVNGAPPCSFSKGPPLELKGLNLGIKKPVPRKGGTGPGDVEEGMAGYLSFGQSHGPISLVLCMIPLGYRRNSPFLFLLFRQLSFPAMYRLKKSAPRPSTYWWGSETTYTTTSRLPRPICICECGIESIVSSKVSTGCVGCQKNYGGGFDLTDHVCSWCYDSAESGQARGGDRKEDHGRQDVQESQLIDIELVWRC